jgi:hypothetical protein
MFARPCVAPPSPDLPANLVGNRCVQWNRSRQWNAQRTQRGGVEKSKALHAFLNYQAISRLRQLPGADAHGNRPEWRK